jgi:undecaprenyl-diphosphatase
MPAAVAVGAGTWGFLKLAEEVLEGETRAVDEWAVAVLRRPDAPEWPRGPGWLVEAARDITALGGPAVLLLATFAVAVYLVLLRQYRGAALVLLLVIGGGVLCGALKMLFARPRPAVPSHVVVATSASFPSGHAKLSAVVYLSLAAFLAHTARKMRVKAFFLGAGALLTFLVGVSRVYLGVHFPTDVLAGWLAGLVWAATCWLVAGYWLRRPAGALRSEGVVTR